MVEVAKTCLDRLGVAISGARKNRVDDNVMRGTLARLYHRQVTGDKKHVI
jgi:hypothetical protein